MQWACGACRWSPVVTDAWQVHAGGDGNINDGDDMGTHALLSMGGPSSDPRQPPPSPALALMHARSTHRPKQFKTCGNASHCAVMIVQGNLKIAAQHKWLRAHARVVSGREHLAVELIDIIMLARLFGVPCTSCTGVQLTNLPLHRTTSHPARAWRAGPLPHNTCQLISQRPRGGKVCMIGPPRMP